MRKQFVLVIAASLLLGGCNSATTPTPLLSSAFLSNLQIREIGLADTCTLPGYFDYTAYDEVTFDTKPVDPNVPITETVFQIVGNERISLGAINACAPTTTPCTAPTSVCLTRADSTGRTIRIYRKLDWTPQYNWNILIKRGSDDSNVLSFVLNRPDVLPYGDHAAIAHVFASKTSPGTAFNIAAYSPGVPGRRIRLRLEVWSNGVVVIQRNDDVATHAEVPGFKVAGFGGSLNWPAGQLEFVALLDELDATGAVIATDRKSVIVN